MRNLDELATLHGALKDERVLSVYLDGSATDPARQRLWRAQLDHCLADLRERLRESPHDEREAFERCVQLLEEELVAFPQGLRAPGWVAFITPERVHEASALHVAVPTQAGWNAGLNVAPYLHALRDSRPVVVAIVDSTKARLYLSRLNAVEVAETIHAHHAVMPAEHMGRAPRQGFHAGTHGTPGRDQAQRSLLGGTTRMLGEAADRITTLAGRDSWVVLGGIPDICLQLQRRLTRIPAGRITQAAWLDVHATDAQAASAARRAAASLRDAADATRVHEIVERASSTGFGVLGPDTTRRALEEARVRALLVTARYLGEHPADAEDAVRAALEQRATVQEVSGAAGAELDAHGGVAAQLRYRLASENASQ